MTQFHLSLSLSLGIPFFRIFALTGLEKGRDLRGNRESTNQNREAFEDRIQGYLYVVEFYFYWKNKTNGEREELDEDKEPLPPTQRPMAISNLSNHPRAKKYTMAVAVLGFAYIEFSGGKKSL